MFSLCTSLNFLSTIPYLSKGSSCICISKRITRAQLGYFIGHSAKDFLPGIFALLMTDKIYVMSCQLTNELQTRIERALESVVLGSAGVLTQTFYIHELSRTLISCFLHWLSGAPSGHFHVTVTATVQCIAMQLNFFCTIRILNE